MNNLLIAEKIKELRIAKNLTQSYVAKNVGLNDSAYSKIEQGITHITIERLYQIADCLKVSVSDLLELDNSYYYVCFEKDFGHYPDEFSGEIKYRVYEYTNLELALEKTQFLNENANINPNVERFICVSTSKKVTKLNKKNYKLL